MTVLEEPFVTRESILSVLRPGEVTTESQFRTLKVHGAASAGLPVTLRTRGGQILGRLQLYCGLNTDAARAFRLRQVDLARELANRAEAVERSPEAHMLQEAVALAAAELPLDPRDPDVSPNLRRYLGLRTAASWQAMDQGSIVREWLTHSEAWLVSTNYDALLESVLNVTRAVDHARAEVLPESHVTTFYGTVARMDDIVAEIEGVDDHALLVPRDDLDRQGLASLGQAVAVLREILPGGGSYSIPMAAVAVDRDHDTTGERSPFDEPLAGDGGVAFDTTLADRDGAWMDRTLRRSPLTPIAAPLPIA